jgi:hypothetical protein
MLSEQAFPSTYATVDTFILMFHGGLTMTPLGFGGNQHPGAYFCLALSTERHKPNLAAV